MGGEGRPFLAGVPKSDGEPRWWLEGSIAGGSKVVNAPLGRPSGQGHSVSGNRCYH